MVKICGFYLKNFEEEAILTESVWALGFYLEVPESRGERIAQVASLDIIERLTSQLCERSFSLSRAALRVLGQFACGSEELTFRLVSQDLVDKLICCVHSEASVFRFDACWAIGNIVSSGKEFAEKFVCLSLFDQLLFISLNDKLPEISKEALGCLAAFISTGEPDVIQMLVAENNALSVLGLCLDRETVCVVKGALECLELLLGFGEELGSQGEENKVAELFLEGPYFFHLENLAGSSSNVIANHARGIIERYFCSESK